MLTAALTIVLLFGAIAAAGWTAGSAQDTGPQATIQAQQTTIAELEGTVEARGKKINAQRTQIAEYKTRVADLENQVPPTATPTPELSGKDAYTWLADPRELDVRPHNHIGEKWVFCGTVTFLQVAGVGSSLYPADNVTTSWDSVLQVWPPGYDVRFMVGFDGDTSGIFEDSYVCVWGTVVDTASGSNAFGGSIVNALFDAEFVELG
jgi:hypothetical protein